MMMMMINRVLNDNQLGGTIPSSIGSLVGLSYLYAQSTMTSTNTHSPMFFANNKGEYMLHDTHTLSLSLSLSMMMMMINRILNDNQLNGTIPSSIGSLVNLRELYAQSNEYHKSYSCGINQPNNQIGLTFIDEIPICLCMLIFLEQISPEQRIGFAAAIVLANQARSFWNRSSQQLIGTNIHLFHSGTRCHKPTH